MQNYKVEGNSKAIELNLGNLSEGIYILKYQSERFSLVEKIIIHK
ncbi:MAG: hypothetical protein ACI97N_002640 [Cognaticolwellia sp.]|jgi:hypothetical protein